MKYSGKLIIIGFSLLCCFTSIQAAWEYPGCDDVTKNDFKLVPVIQQQLNDPTLMEPLKMDFDMDESGNVWIYYVQRRGQAKVYDPITKQVSTIANVSPETGNEDGLIGIALHPEFKTNHWIFLFYSKGEDFRISRFAYDSTKKELDMSSEIIMLKIPSGRGRWHTGGGMQFDDYGDLWIAVGDNEASELGPANTADLRGGIVRIHPEDDGSYTIPDGNLWEYAAEYFENQGKNNIAEEYRDERRARREIWAMGTRNAYTLTIDPVRRWATYGDCGPDYASRSATNPDDFSEEHTVVTEPSFLGWPYWTGYRYTQPNKASNYDEPNEAFWGDKDMNAPLNLNSYSEGVDLLLPATPATHAYPHQCAMSGPIYRYDGDLQSPYKLPPHFDRVWFVADFNQKWVKALQLSENGKSVLKEEEMWKGDDFTGAWGKMLDFQAGPDGGLYMLGYTCNTWRQVNECTGIYRIEYTGSCHPEEPKLETAGCTDPLFEEFNPSVPAEHHNQAACKTPATGVAVNGAAGGIVINRMHISIGVPGRYSMSIQDVKGATVFSTGGEGPVTLPVSGIGKTGVYFVRVTTSLGTFSRRLMFY